MALDKVIHLTVGLIILYLYKFIKSLKYVYGIHSTRNGIRFQSFKLLLHLSLYVVMLFCMTSPENFIVFRNVARM